MKKLQRIVLFPLLLLMPTIASSWMIIMAVQGNGVFGFCKHVSKNIIVLGSRIPQLIASLDKKTFASESSPSLLSVGIILVGMPFIVIMILLDDIE